MKFVEITPLDAGITVVNRVVFVANDIHDLMIFKRDFDRAHGVAEAANGVLCGGAQRGSPGIVTCINELKDSVMASPRSNHDFPGLPSAGGHFRPVPRVKIGVNEGRHSAFSIDRSAFIAYFKFINASHYVAGLLLSLARNSLK